MKKFLAFAFLSLLGSLAFAQNQIVVTTSEDYYNGDATYSLKVDGVTVSTGTVCTARGGKTATTKQSNTFSGNWPATKAHAVMVTFTNDVYGGSSSADRNLYVWSVTLDGQPTTGNMTPQSSATNWIGWVTPPSVWAFGTGGSLNWATKIIASPITAVPMAPTTASTTLGPVGITIVCNAAGTYTIGPLTLSCSQAGTVHQVFLTWTATTTCDQTNPDGSHTIIPCTPTGYYVYRGQISGGPYSKLGPSAVTSYTDLAVTGGQTYYYVVTAYFPACTSTAPCGESGFSNQAQAVIP